MEFWRGLEWHLARRFRCLVLLGVFCLGLATPAASVRAAPQSQVNAGSGLQVSNALINVELAAGQTYVHHLTIGIGTDAPAMQLSVTACGLGQGLDGHFIAEDADADTSPYSGRSLITSITPATFSLKPGGSADVEVSITLPSEASADTRYATLFIAGVPTTSSGQVSNQVSMLIPVVITPTSAVKNRTGAITNINFTSVKVGSPIVVSVTLQNTGNRHFKAEGQVTVYDPEGDIAAVISVAPNGTSIIPTYSQVITGASAHLTAVKKGTYLANIVITTDDGEVIASQEGVRLKTGSSSNSGSSATSTPTATTSGYANNYSNATPTVGTLTPSSTFLSTGFVKTYTPAPFNTETSGAGAASTASATPALPGRSQGLQAVIAGLRSAFQAFEAQLTNPWVSVSVLLILIELLFIIFFLVKRRRKKE